MICYRQGGCGPYEMRPCSECPASKPEYAKTYQKKEQSMSKPDLEISLVEANEIILDLKKQIEEKDDLIKRANWGFLNEQIKLLSKSLRENENCLTRVSQHSRDLATQKSELIKQNEFLESQIPSKGKWQNVESLQDIKVPWVDGNGNLRWTAESRKWIDRRCSECGGMLGIANSDKFCNNCGSDNRTKSENSK